MGTPHSCPLPTAWPNKQGCFLLGVGIARLGFLPLHAITPHTAPYPPQFPTAPASHTLTLWSAWGARGAGMRTHFFLLPGPHCPQLQQTPGGWWRTSPWALESETWVQTPLHLQLCHPKQSPLHLSESQFLHMQREANNCDHRRGCYHNEVSTVPGTRFHSGRLRSPGQGLRLCKRTPRASLLTCGDKRTQPFPEGTPH